MSDDDDLMGGPPLSVDDQLSLIKSRALWDKYIHGEGPLARERLFLIAEIERLRIKVGEPAIKWWQNKPPPCR
jgi:hypothetical protein